VTIVSSAGAARVFSQPTTAPDPFLTPARSRAPSRPRLLSYVGRWGRARRWLPSDALKVLDVGCSFGYGTAAVAAAPPARRIAVGVERDPAHLARGRRTFPWLTILDGDAAALPVPDACADAVLLLDIVEHLADPRDALTEAHRALRPGGVVVLSVPHRGLLHRLDSLNVYEALRRRRPSWPPLDAAAESGSGMHRHFTPAELQTLLAPWFAVERSARTGLGLQEVVHLFLLLLRVFRPLRPVVSAALPLHLVVYVLDDLVPWGPLGYHLTVRARVLPIRGVR
jgi:SAM-dependent methyltransferase